MFGEILQKVLGLSETPSNNGTIKTEIEYFKKYSYKNSITDHSDIGKLTFQGLYISALTQLFENYKCFMGSGKSVRTDTLCRNLHGKKKCIRGL